MHPLKLSQCAPESGIMWEARCAMLGAGMGFGVLCHPGDCWGKRTVAQPGGPSSWLKSYPLSMSNARVHTGLCQQLLTEVFFAELDRPHKPHWEPTGQPKWEAHSCRVPLRIHSSLGPGSCQRYVSISFCFCSCTLFGESLHLMPILTQKAPDSRRNGSLALLSSSSISLFCPSAEAIELCIHAWAEIWTCIGDTDLRN